MSQLQGKPYEYQRILEILDDYWLSEPDELSVEVYMQFVKDDGQTQFKRIYWINDQIYRRKNIELPLIPICDITKIGKWEKGVSENGVTTALFCSACHYENKHWYEWNFCPYCGAKMEHYS